MKEQTNNPLARSFYYGFFAFPLTILVAWLLVSGAEIAAIAVLSAWDNQTQFEDERLQPYLDAAEEQAQSDIAAARSEVYDLCSSDTGLDCDEVQALFTGGGEPMPGHYWHQAGE